MLSLIAKCLACDCHLPCAWLWGTKQETGHQTFLGGAHETQPAHSHPHHHPSHIVLFLLYDTLLPDLALSTSPTLSTGLCCVCVLVLRNQAQQSHSLGSRSTFFTCQHSDPQATPFVPQADPARDQTIQTHRRSISGVHGNALTRIGIHCSFTHSFTAP